MLGFLLVDDVYPSQAIFVMGANLGYWMGCLFYTTNYAHTTD